jgi:hypothetical protein
MGRRRHVGTSPSDGSARRATPPAQLVAEAARHPNGWVYEIDTGFVDDPNGYVPPEAIRGGWKVDGHGKLTGEYKENPRYGPPQDDFAKLTESGHWLAWLGDDPAREVRESVAEIVDSQVAGTVLEWMKIVEEPRFLTFGRRHPDNSEKLIVSRAGMAAEFAAGVRAPAGRREILWGVYSVAVTGLDRPGAARSQVWFDPRVRLDWAEEQLRIRIYEVDRPV